MDNIIIMVNEQLLAQLEGLHTIETAMQITGLTKQSTLNLLSTLKKEQYLTTTGGGKQKRLYKITQLKQLPRSPGMFDLLNKYSPHMKLNPWYDHQVHGKYSVEDALIDAIKTKSFRVILVSLCLFSHITDWRKLHRLAKQHDCIQQVGALYDVARLYFRTKYFLFKSERKKDWIKLTQLEKKNFPSISEKWHVYIPFNEHDIRGEIV